MRVQLDQKVIPDLSDKQDRPDRKGKPGHKAYKDRKAIQDQLDSKDPSDRPDPLDLRVKQEQSDLKEIKVIQGHKVFKVRKGKLDHKEIPGLSEQLGHKAKLDRKDYKDPLD